MPALRIVLLTLLGALVVGMAWLWTDRGRSSSSAGLTVHAPNDLQQQLLRENVGRAGDPVLSAMFVDIARRHFMNQLAPVPVRWEPGLARASQLDGGAYTLQGMFGALGGRSVILLNPEIRDDHPTVVRALCHEMVHAYLHATGDEATRHGPAFQSVLRRLSEEGAFEGVVADPDERARVRAWLDAESARLDTERAALDELGAELGRERQELERLVAAVVPKGEDAASDLAALSARRDAHNARAIDANERVARFNRDVEHFHREIARYNLMVVYPDGIDEDEVFRATAKTAS